MLNNPFCYTPSPEIVKAARSLTERIDNDTTLSALFAGGKMMGVLQVGKPDGAEDFLYAFSGTAAGRSTVEGFVPPIFEYGADQIRSDSPDRSRELQRWLFDNYVVLNGRGERSTVRDIFARRGVVPPGGTGDCAAPKLLQQAFLHGLKPIAMGEFWYGASPSCGEVRRSGCFYPSCTGKCGPLLDYMLQGVEVEPNPLENDSLWSLAEPVVRYEDAELVVVEKPSGMLSVPGRTSRKSLQEWLSDRCGCRIYSCHRLDMDTSGLMVFARTAAAQTSVQRQFENRQVTKYYTARLCPPSLPDEIPPRGRITLPLAPDYYDRPRQKVDYAEGKAAVTEYEIIRRNVDGTTDLRLTPYTGRTHQLRVHCASPLGLDRPIAGDRLYGGLTDGGSGVLMLHAAYISLHRPGNGSRVTFRSERVY